MKKSFWIGLITAVVIGVLATFLLNTPRAEAIRVPEFKEVTILTNCDGTYDITVYTNTNRNWRVRYPGNAPEYWINPNQSHTWENIPAGRYELQYWHDNQWKAADLTSDSYKVTEEKENCGTIRWCFPNKQPEANLVEVEEHEFYADTWPANEDLPKEGKPWETGMDKWCEVSEPPALTQHEGCRDNCSPAAPVCPDGKTTQLVANMHVLRAGDKATVNFFLTEGNSANIYYKEVSASGWQHSVSDVKPNGDRFVSYTIGGLDPNLGYTFGAQQKTGCGGGEIATSVVVDGPATMLFTFSYWQW